MLGCVKLNGFLGRIQDGICNKREFRILNETLIIRTKWTAIL